MSRIHAASCWHAKTFAATVLLISSCACAESVVLVSAIPGGDYDTLAGIALSHDNATLYVADRMNSSIKQISIATATTQNLAGGVKEKNDGKGGIEGDKDGIGASATFSDPSVLVVSPDGSTLYFAGNCLIRKMIFSTAEVITIAGGGTDDQQYPSCGDKDGKNRSATHGTITSMAISPDGSILFVAENYYNKIRKLTIATAEVTTIAGDVSKRGNVDGTASSAKFNYVTGFALSPDGSNLYFTDKCLVRKMIVATSEFSTLAGGGSDTGTECGNADGTARLAKFEMLWGLALSPNAEILYIVDRKNNLLRSLVIATGKVVTLAGGGSDYGGIGRSVLLQDPVYVVSSRDGTILYLTESKAKEVKKIELFATTTRTFTSTSTTSFTLTSATTTSSTLTSSKSSTSSKTSTSSKVMSVSSTYTSISPPTSLTLLSALIFGSAHGLQ